MLIFSHDVVEQCTSCTDMIWVSLDFDDGRWWRNRGMIKCSFD